MMKFSQLLRQERTLRGWSQARIASELGTTANTISAWERGLSLPSPYFREKLCTLFGKNAQEWGFLPSDDSQPVVVAAQQEEEVSYTPSMDYKETLPAQEIPLFNAIEGGDNGPASSAYPLHISSAHPFPEKKSGFSAINPLPAPVASLLQNRVLLLVCLLALLIGSVALALTWPLITSPNPYAAGTGRLTLYDPLKDQGQHLNWQEGWNENGASCQFKRDAYYATQPLEGYFHACIAQATTFRNFTYEVEATLYQGDYVGIIFRAVSSLDSKYYLFRVYSDGTYMLKRYVDRVDDHAILLDQGTAEPFHRGLGQTNRLAVVAEEQHLTLYINQQQVTALSDQAYPDGQIGVLAGNEHHPPAEAAFRNVKVWS